MGSMTEADYDELIVGMDTDELAQVGAALLANTWAASLQPSVGPVGRY